MKTLAYGRWAVLALLLILAIPMRADAREHWYRHWYHYHHVVVPAYGIPAYGVAPRYLAGPPIPSYAPVPAYGLVPSYGVASVPVYAPYPYYHLSKHQMAAYNQLGRMERYAATHQFR